MCHRGVRIVLGTLSTLSLAFLFAEESVRKPIVLTIPLDLEVNGQSMGEISVESDASMMSVSLDTVGFKSRLTSFRSKQLQELLLDLPDGFIPLLELQIRGFEIFLDLEILVLALNIEEDRASIDSNRQQIRIGHQETISKNARHVGEANVSGYANFNIRLSRSKNELGTVRDYQSLGIDHALNLFGIALEGDSAWTSNENRDSGSFQLNRLRLVKDFPNSMHRLVIGDISTPIKSPQRGFQIWGLSFAKEFNLQPYRTFTPTSSASFQLDENAIVQMQMNGRPMRSLKLEPGIYDIEQFKLAAGLNSMDLEIVTESGTVERIQIDNYGEPTLLGKGASTFALSFGMPYAAPSENTHTIIDTPWYQRTISREPLFSGYYQKGLSDRVTANANLQSTHNWTRVGLQTTWVSGVGVINANAGFNSLHSSQAKGMRLNVDWKREFKGYQFALSGSRSSRNFELTKENTSSIASANRDSVSLRIAKRFGKRASMDLSFLRQRSYHESPERSAALNFGYRFPAIHTSLSFRHSDSRFERSLSSYLTVTWNPRERLRTRTRYGHSSNGVNSGTTTNLDYSNSQPQSSLNANLNIRSSDTGRELDGRTRYETDRYSITASRMYLYQNINDYENKGIDTSLSGEFALAFADGAFGVTRRVSDSFAIVTNHSAWKDVELGINPTLGGFEQTTSKSFARPVLSDLRAYRESQAIIRPLGGDTFLENEEFHFLPSYKRGSKLTIGNEFIYSLRSTLVHWNEQPVRYKALKISGDGIEDILTFTNNAGKFVVTGLKPGSYKIDVNGTNEFAIFEISGNEKLEFIEQIILEDTPYE
ncbi:MAG: outer membrane usher protein [Candidatus Pelagisphaera sp.]|jgi:outer membrane usher protein